jgi:serine/threonine protein kinase
VNAERAQNETMFAPGRALDGGKYRLIRKLGAGGMGEVFEAENTLTHKRVAIKCLHPARAQRAEASARLLREAEAASRIRHPHVVDVYDVGREGDSVFLVMEYLEGEPLSQLLARGGTPIHELISLLLPAMRAVAAAHRMGVVHRDIKPDNIFLALEADNERPVAKVLDFGISKLSTHDGELASLTRSGSTLGTPRYMAYEQLMSGKSIDGRVDVYAFGVILYEALTGHSPFEAETYPELIVKIAQGDMVPPKQLRPEIPSTLDRLVCWALERDRDRRVSSVDELIRELEPFSNKRLLQAEMATADPLAQPLLAAGFSSTIRSKTAPTEFSPSVVESSPPARGRVTGLMWTCLGMIAVGAVAGWAWRPGAREPEAGRASSMPPAPVASAGAAAPAVEHASSLPPEPVLAAGAAAVEPSAPSAVVPAEAVSPKSPGAAAVEPPAQSAVVPAEAVGPKPPDGSELPSVPKPRAAKPKPRAADKAVPAPLESVTPKQAPAEATSVVEPPPRAAEPVRADPPPEAAKGYRVKVPQSKEF